MQSPKGAPSSCWTLLDAIDIVHADLTNSLLLFSVKSKENERLEAERVRKHEAVLLSLMLEVYREIGNRLTLYRLVSMIQSSPEVPLTEEGVAVCLSFLLEEGRSGCYRSHSSQSPLIVLQAERCCRAPEESLESPSRLSVRGCRRERHGGDYCGI